MEERPGRNFAACPSAHIAQGVDASWQQGTKARRSGQSCSLACRETPRPDAGAALYSLTPEIAWPMRAHAARNRPWLPTAKSQVTLLYAGGSRWTATRSCSHRSTPMTPDSADIRKIVEPYIVKHSPR